MFAGVLAVFGMVFMSTFSLATELASSNSAINAYNMLDYDFDLFLNALDSVILWS